MKLASYYHDKIKKPIQKQKEKISKYMDCSDIDVELNQNPIKTILKRPITNFKIGQKTARYDLNSNSDWDQPPVITSGDTTLTTINSAPSILNSEIRSRSTCKLSRRNTTNTHRSSYSMISSFHGQNILETMEKAYNLGPRLQSHNNTFNMTFDTSLATDSATESEIRSFAHETYEAKEILSQKNSFQTILSNDSAIASSEQERPPRPRRSPVPGPKTIFSFQQFLDNCLDLDSFASQKSESKQASISSATTMKPPLTLQDSLTTHYQNPNLDQESDTCQDQC